MSELIIDADVIANNTVLDAELESVVILGSGGGGGTKNYNLLDNKPRVNGVTLQGNKTLDDLGITSAIGTEVETYVEAHKEELKGDKGDDGFSPSARVEQSSGGAIVTVTDESGTTTATISNGVDGAPGADGHDYVLTSADKSEIADMVIGGGATFSATVNGQKLVINDTANGNEVNY